MCGIIGIVWNNKGKHMRIGNAIYDALSRLEYRGYDSVGLAVISKNEQVRIEKDKGKIGEVGQKLQFKNIDGYTAIGHSRWATHGPPSLENSHPHKSMNGKIAVVHNGIIENFISLKEELEGYGFVFQSQTDTELIPHFLEWKISGGLTMLDAIKELTKAIKGTYALVITHVDEPNRIYALRKDNPLVLGISENANYCASDIPAFLEYTKNVIILRDNELAILEPDTYDIRKMPEMKPVNRKPHQVTWTAEAAQKGGFPHFMLKEIHEQSKVLGFQLATQQTIFPEIAEMVHEAEKVILVAAGTAHYASLNAYHTFPKMGGKLVLPCIAAEWDAVKSLVDDDTLILAVSQSGETLDTMKAIKDARVKNARVASIVNVTGSSLTTISDKVAYIHAGPEIGVAATKTYTAQSYATSRIAYHLAQLTGNLDSNELQEFSTVINTIPETVQKIVAKTESHARDLSNWFKQKHSAFYLGRGISHVTALEGALKMKEISYLHAEAYPAGESKHGPIALVEDDYPVVFSIPLDETRDKMLGSVQEMAARGARTIGIIDEADKEMSKVLSHYFTIPKGFSNFLTPISYIIPQQLLAYYTSVKKGANPDMPRNLAKSVTVE
ncbi:MAG: glutamine--fructose-6-phosphate transaminase (isomerizing) [Candidatus Heimdallarchaeota archaeon]|nr:glutamine--fructose-6-phosphate transaminase (isomerizing) [Candidatus Heimdallarchaeota archaeon]